MDRSALGVFGTSGPSIGNLYISGFNNPVVSGIPGTGISRYDGTNFYALGPSFRYGISGAGYCMVEYQGSLYVAGSFRAAGDIAGSPITANNLAYWDGSAWHAVGATPNGLTTSGDAAYAHGNRMCVCGGLLYIMGSFNQAGPTPSNFLCCWDGSNFTDSGLASAAGSALNEFALMTTDGTTVFVTLNNNSGPGYPSFAYGTRGSWTVVNAGGSNPDYTETANSIGDMAMFGGQIASGGYFIDNTPGYIYPNSYSAGGATWSRGGDPFSFQQSSYFINAACYFSDPAIAGGNLLALFSGYTAAGGGTPIANIYQWSGGAWSTLYPIPYPTPFGGIYSPRPQNLAQWNGKLWFSGTDGSLGYWDTGTSAWVPVLNFPTGSYYQEGIFCMISM